VERHGASIAVEKRANFIVTDGLGRWHACSASAHCSPTDTAESSRYSWCRRFDLTIGANGTQSLSAPTDAWPVNLTCLRSVPTTNTRPLARCRRSRLRAHAMRCEPPSPCPRMSSRSASTSRMIRVICVDSVTGSELRPRPRTRGGPRQCPTACGKGILGPHQVAEAPCQRGAAPQSSPMHPPAGVDPSISPATGVNTAQ